MTARQKRPGRRALSVTNYGRLAEFRYVLRHFLIFSEGAAIAAGLSAQQHQALLAIKGTRPATPVTAGLLAERLGIRHHSAVGLLDRLADKNLIRRQRNIEDRRQVLVLLTPKAERLLARLSAAHQRELRRVAPLLRGLLTQLARR
ncbi:MAG TPA: MarR family transcriptional regulator [Stellaceae bacterium]|jgi:DNA-binding MarR family transcriptional regulator|nr:MarR family transcriptional regulator [Stellaceae bacterium]